jgi:hypothetical protein
MFVLRGHMSALRVTRGLAAMVLLTLTLTPGRALQAQDLSYTTVTKVEFGGAMGMMMQMVPDTQQDMSQTVYIKGNLMRTDDDDTSTITDMAEGRFTHLDHGSRTWYSVTLAQMQEQMEQAREQMAQSPEYPGAAMPPTEEGSFEIRMSTDRTGRKRDFDGYSAEQVLITMEMVPTSPEAVEAADTTGKMVLFTELWISNDFPGAEAYQAAQERMGEAFMEGGGAGMAGAMSQAMMGNPDMKKAMEQNREEMKNVEGVAVRTVTQFVSVPAGMEFDPDAVLTAEDQPLPTSEMPSVADAAKEAAGGALGRRLGGLLGRRNQEREEPETPTGPTTQSITMRSISTIQEINTGSLPDDLFQPPPDYTERQPDWMKGS